MRFGTAAVGCFGDWGMADMELLVQLNLICSFEPFVLFLYACRSLESYSPDDPNVPTFRIQILGLWPCL
jgi:hypothetical protein